MEVTFVHGYIILGDQPNVAPKGYLMGKGSITPLDHFEKYWDIHQYRPNFRYPLGVEELKGFQLQDGFVPLNLWPWTPLGASPQTSIVVKFYCIVIANRVYSFTLRDCFILLSCCWLN